MIHRRLHRNCSQVRGPHKHHISCLPCSCGRAPDHWSLDWAILGESLHPSGRTDCGQSAWSPLQPWCLRPYCGVGSDPLGPLGEYLQIYTGNKNVTLLFWNYLVSTYVVCERLSVMHEPAGVVENLVQILQNTPILKYRIPPPPENWNCQRSWHFDFSVAEYPPPQNENCQRSWHFDFSVAEYPPKMKIVRDLGTLTFQLQNTPPPKKEI